MSNRYVIVGITAVAALFLYIDRVCVSILADPIQTDLGLSDREKARMLGAFFFTYAVHGTVLAVIWRSVVDANGFDSAQLVTQPGTLLLALALRYGSDSVPLRFAARASANEVAA